MFWFGRINFGNIDKGGGVSNLVGEVVDEASLQWEHKLEQVLVADRKHLPSGTKHGICISRKILA